MLRQSPTSPFSSDISSFFFPLSGVQNMFVQTLGFGLFIMSRNYAWIFSWFHITLLYFQVSNPPILWMSVCEYPYNIVPCWALIVSNCSGNPGKHGWCQLVQVAASHSQDTPQDFASSGFRWCCDVSASGGTAGMGSAGVLVTTLG